MLLTLTLVSLFVFLLAVWIGQRIEEADVLGIGAFIFWFLCFGGGVIGLALSLVGWLSRWGVI